MSPPVAAVPDRPVRLLAVHGMAETGGSDQALLRLVRELPRDRFRVDVVVPGPHPLAAGFTAAGARLHQVPVRRISTGNSTADWVRYALAWPVVVLRLVVLVLRTRADVVHTNSLHFWHAWAAALLTGRPHVWHAREVVVQSGLALRLERLLTRRFATLVVAGSRAIAAQLDATRLVVVHDHADPAEFHPMLAGSWRAAQSLPDDVPLVGVLGRLDTWKGFEVALDALPLLQQAVPGTRLVVVGGPVIGKHDYAAALRARTEALPGAVWAGERDDVPAFLADLDVLLVPSTTPEPYGLVVVEALASGCPVVASAAGGPVEILGAALSGAGLLVPPGDAAALARAAARLLRERAAGAAGRRARPVLVDPGRSPLPDLLTAVAMQGRGYPGPPPEPTEPP